MLLVVRYSFFFFLFELVIGLFVSRRGGGIGVYLACCAAVSNQFKSVFFAEENIVAKQDYQQQNNSFKGKHIVHSLVIESKSGSVLSQRCCDEDIDCIQCHFNIRFFAELWVEFNDVHSNQALCIRKTFSNI